MTDKNWSQIGDEIEDMVRKAAGIQGFGKLSQDLSGPWARPWKMWGKVFRTP